MDSPGFVTRIGLALAAPRWALLVADDPRTPGRPGSDVIRLFALVLVCVHTRALVAAAWLGAVVDVRIGLRVATSTLSRAFSAPLAFLVVASLAVWLLGGSRRSLGRAFDLACVALVPIIVVDVIATLVIRAGGWSLPPILRIVVLGAGFSWSGVLVALALVQMRRSRRGGGKV